ncbi:MAG: hypothetical protein SCH98_13525 [Deferrisomatales bacterium]|nr:hypothetical protein [Deferrisomatales bacterium]
MFLKARPAFDTFVQIVFTMGNSVKKASSPYVVLLISLLVLFTAGQGLSSSFVLCIADSGSTAIEQAFGGKCASAETPSCTEGALATHDHCGPCQDLSTSLDFAHGRSQSDQDLSPPGLLPPLVSITPSAFLRDSSPTLFAQPPPRPYHALAALRTIVLLN